MKKIFIIILNWNGGKDTVECLETLWNMEHGTWNMEIVVVDNGSTDGSVETIRKFIEKYSRQFVSGEVNVPPISENSCNPTLKLIENRANLGYAEGNNVGIKYALAHGADYVMLLNNDTLVEKNLVSELLKVMERDKTMGITGPKIYFAPGYEYHHDRYQDKERGRVIWYAGGIIDWQNIYASHRGVDEVDRGQYDRLEETDFVSGCAMMIKREVFDQICILDSRYFLYWEDNDFCQRGKRAGFKIVYVPRAFLWHKNAASSEKPGSKIHQYYQTRNRLLFGLKYAPWRSKIALLKESLRFLLKEEIQREAVVDFFLRRFGGKNYL